MAPIRPNLPGVMCARAFPGQLAHQPAGFSVGVSFAR